MGGRKPVRSELGEQTINLNKHINMMVSLVEEGGRQKTSALNSPQTDKTVAAKYLPLSKHLENKQQS